MTLAEALRAASEITSYNPDDGIDLLGLLIIWGVPTLGTIIVGWLTVRGQMQGRARARKIDAKTTEIHEQTVNDHITKSNLRDDIDEIRDLVKVMSDRQVDQSRDIRGLRKDVGELRGEDRAARTEHDDLVRRLNAFIRREHPGADPL
ncbi:DUF2746 domain-containing protein [Mycolicibacterium fortuitum]|uniref:DUF2746 domain-containing protein n=1 Tax=Mycolicibacterium fortuitum TaxID=1766 RepID=UPI0022BA2BCF|nr:DUF2746 domain-containing protein [Mycolicibacterium fortuitum]WAY18381.1 DUF2746 domain-containing protein [Mycolicibacterium fortuitum]